MKSVKLNLSEQFFSSSLWHLYESYFTGVVNLLLYWPKQQEVSLHYPDCFKKYHNVRAIIDCTEVPIQRPSLSKANSQIYSSYKRRPTAKVLVACTPKGTISFVSQAAGGTMSDKNLINRSGIVDLFSPEDTLVVDDVGNQPDYRVSLPFRVRSLWIPSQKCVSFLNMHNG